MEHSRALAVEPSAAAERAWVDHVNEVVAGTLLPKANSWWMGANIPGKAHQVVAYAGGFPAYRQHAEQALASFDAYRLLGASQSELQRQSR